MQFTVFDIKINLKSSGINILKQINLTLLQKITVYISIIFFVMFINLLQLKEITESFEMLTIGVFIIGMISFILSFIFKQTAFTGVFTQK